MSRPWKIADLNPDEPIKISLMKILLGWIQEMLSYASGTIKGKDIEALHDMRVSALRIRVLLKLHRKYFPKKALRQHLQDLKRLIDSMGPVREIDVFQAELRKLAEDASPKDRIALKWLLAQREMHREVRQMFMKTEIRRLLHAGFRQRLERFIEESLQ
jgi:CHAD domain-containing protein